MKYLINAIPTFVVVLLSLNVSAQEKTEAVHKEVRKEVKMEEINGEKVLTISTSENGKETLETYKGKEAEQKLEEFQRPSDSSQEIKEEIKVEEVNGEKTMTITKTINGVEKTEVLKGDAIDEKLKELNFATPPSEKPKTSPKTIKKSENHTIQKVENN